MENFAEQCLDMAHSILSNNLDSITDQGTITPLQNEVSNNYEAGHASLAIGEYYRATNKLTLDDYDLVDLSAKTITAQAFAEESHDNGLAYSALGLLSFGLAKDRNPVWERLLDETREQLDNQLLERNDYSNHFQAFNIAKSVTRYSIGLSKKDETGKLIDRFLSRIEEHSTGGYFDDLDSDNEGLNGTFDIYGVVSFVFIRQALQLHANINLRERKLASLRTSAEKYLKLIPDLVRQDGTGWSFGRSIGAYGQMHCISLILQAMRDGWIPQNKADLYQDTLKKLFLNFFINYLDQEHGYLVIRDEERNTTPQHTNRMANFDAARYLCQWSRLIKSIGNSYASNTIPSPRKIGRFVHFDRSNKKEQGLFIYQDPDSLLSFQLPLIAPNKKFADTCDYLAFPHAPGLFDWPVNTYMPIMVPELTFGDKVIVPSYYGKNCTTKVGLRNTLQFSYNQPELITKEGDFVNGLGSCSVHWAFQGGKINCEYVFTVKNQVTLSKFRYVIAISSPHSTYRIGTSYTLGENGHGTTVLKDDFQANWRPIQTVTDDLNYRSYYGNIHYFQILERDHPLVMRKGVQYRLAFSFEPDIKFVDE
jgi:hypothetical protein